MARRALAAAALAALTLTTATLVVDNDVLATTTWGQRLGYAAEAPDPDDSASATPTSSADVPEDVRSSRRPQSGGPGAIRIPDLLAPVLPGPDAEGGDGGGDGGDGLLAAPLRSIGNLLFASGFEDGLGNWGRHDSQGSIDIVTSPVREGRNAVRLTAQDDGGETVRTQLDGPTLFEEGSESYIGWSTYFPTDMPAVPSGAWYVFFEFHGPPFNGSPLPGVFQISDEGGEQRIGLSRSEQYGYDVPWTMPMVKGRWVDFVAHVKFSRDEGTGFVELWVDGQQQTFADGTQRLRSATMMSDQDSLYPIATNYYQGGAIDQPMVVYHDAIRVGGSYGSAAPAGG